MLINPNTSVQTTDMMLKVARPLLPPEITLSGLAAVTGAAMILDDTALAIAEKEVIRMGKVCSEGADLIIVAAFGDPGVQKLRESLDIPVVGIGEAAMIEAAAGGRRFGIATTTPKLTLSIETHVSRLGLHQRFTGLRVPPCDPLLLAADPAKQDSALAQAVLDCIKLDGAEAVVIGGGPLSGTAARLRQTLDITVIEPVPAAIRAAVCRLGMI